MNPTIGVCIPCRNYERFLPECLASVKAQEMKLTCVVIDDYSDDKFYVAKVVKRARIDLQMFVQLVQLPEPRGIGIARNIGAAYLNTDLILFLDADDTLHAGAIATLTNCAADQDLDFVYGDYTEAGKTVRAPLWIPQTLEHQNIASYCNLWRRDSFWGIGGYSDITVAEDWELQKRAAKAGLFGFHVDALIFEHRIHDANKWTADSAQYGGLAGVAQLLKERA